MRRMKIIISECVGPRCSKPEIRRSMSGIMETKRRITILDFTFRSRSVIFPVMYPKAKCPTANIFFATSNVFDSFYQSGNHKCFSLVEKYSRCYTMCDHYSFELGSKRRCIYNSHFSPKTIPKSLLILKYIQTNIYLKLINS